MWDKNLINRAKGIIENIWTEDTLPQRKDILRFTEINPEKIKVVILGQDPYPTPGVANGRAFAVNKGSKLPMSLRNIFNEIKEVQGYVKTDETLQSWVDQGVLLLNTSLTVMANRPNSDQLAWKNFSKELIIWLDNRYKFTWILWGNNAKSYENLLSNKVISDAHPSPLSVRYRQKNTFKEIAGIEW